MPAITVRDVPDSTRNELAARAARSGQSLQEYLRAQLIELARRPEPAALLADVRRRVERDGVRLGAATIVRHRNAGRR